MLATPMPLTFQIGAAILVIAAGFFDLRERRVPNWLSLGGFLLGILLNLTAAGASGLKTAMLGAGLALLIYVPLWLLHAMGAGDAKLMAAIGAIIGPSNWFSVFLVTAILGGLVAIIAIVVTGRFRRTFSNLYVMILALMDRTAPYKVSSQLDVQSTDGFRMPHAVVIAMGCLAVLVVSSGHVR